MESFAYLIHNLSPAVMPVARLCVWLVLLTAVFTPFERLFAIHPQKLFRKGVGTDLLYYFLSGLLPSILLGIPMGMLAWAVHRFVPAAFTAGISAWPAWLRLTAALIVGEIGFYWGHRWSHEIPLLWRFHSIHHSAEQMDWLVSSRAHPVDVVFTRLCGLIPLYLLGLAAPLRGSATLIPLLVIVIGTAWGFFVHANIRWRFGPLEWLIATPAFHHWHHTNDGPEFIDKNYSPMLPWVDRAFGTLYLPARHHPAKYGINQCIAPGIIEQLIHPFVSTLAPQNPVAAHRIGFES